MTAVIGRNRGDALAQGLGWFSIGLGLVQLASARAVANGLGLHGQERLVQAYGLREIATGLGILAARGEDRAPWLWGRVAGDALDLAVETRFEGQHDIGITGPASPPSRR